MKAVRHFGIVVSNMEKSLRFYQDFLGLEIKIDSLEKGRFIDSILGLQNVKVRTVKMLAKNQDVLVELLHFKSPFSKKRMNRKIFDIGPSHLALTVKNIDKIYNKFKKQGVRFNSLPLMSPNNKAKVAFCFDPDNNPIELVEEIS